MGEAHPADLGHRDHRNTLLATALVVLVLLTPGDTMPADDELPWFLALPWVQAWGDKVVHGLLFFVHTALLARSVRHGAFASPHTITLGLAMFFATGTELLQRFIPGRQGSLGDLAADSLGIVLALGLGVVGGARRHRGESPNPREITTS